MSNITLSLRDASRLYFTQGWKVLPLFGVTDNGQCQCTQRFSWNKHPSTLCDRPGKHPACAGGVHNAFGPKDLSKNKKCLSDIWFIRNSLRVNIAVATGNGLFVLDVDRLDALNDLPYTLPSTTTVATPRGGRHYYFRCSTYLHNGTNLVPGIDFRGENGYVVAPPSRTAAGSYQLIHPERIEVAKVPILRGPGWREVYPELPLADIPDWLLLLVNAHGTKGRMERCADGAVGGGCVHTTSTFASTSAQRYSLPTNYNFTEDAESLLLNHIYYKILSAPCGDQERTISAQMFSLAKLVAEGRARHAEALTLIECLMHDIPDLDKTTPWNRDALYKKMLAKYHKSLNS